jgi:hypothetical protein
VGGSRKVSKQKKEKETGWGGGREENKIPKRKN